MPNPTYGQTPGFKFEDWSKISNQDWNNPNYWQNLGQQQWGPEPVSSGQQQQTWDNWTQAGGLESGE